MSFTDILINMPWSYTLILIVFSLYYGIRAIVEQVVKHGSDKSINLTTKIILFYAQEFLFKIIITTSAFMALFIANYIFLSVKPINSITPGTAILLIFLIIWGVTGASGYLTFLIVTGRFPGVGKG